MSMENFVNTVPGENQLKDNDCLSYILQPHPSKKVLLIGNSITRHNPSAEIGWHGDWGMAASSEDKDYVHILYRDLTAYFGPISMCVAQASAWEVTAPALKEEKLCEKYAPAAEFGADLIIVRIGENIDMQHTDVSQLAESFQKMIAFFGGEKENVEVILTGLFWNYPQQEEAVKCALVGKNYHFVFLTDLGMDEKMTAMGLFSHAGVAGHPGDLGMEHIARRIMNQVQKIYPQEK